VATTTGTARCVSFVYMWRAGYSTAECAPRLLVSVVPNQRHHRPNVAARRILELRRERSPLTLLLLLTHGPLPAHSCGNCWCPRNEDSQKTTPRAAPRPTTQDPTRPVRQNRYRQRVTDATNPRTGSQVRERGRRGSDARRATTNGRAARYRATSQAKTTQTERVFFYRFQSDRDVFYSKRWKG